MFRFVSFYFVFLVILGLRLHFETCSFWRTGSAQTLPEIVNRCGFVRLWLWLFLQMQRDTIIYGRHVVRHNRKNWIAWTICVYVPVLGCDPRHWITQLPIKKHFRIYQTSSTYIQHANSLFIECLYIQLIWLLIHHSSTSPNPRKNFLWILSLSQTGTFGASTIW